MSFKRLLFLVKVEGLSCWPFLRPGKRYLATSFGKPQKGDFVVFRHEDKFLVKRVVGREGKRYLAESTLPQAKAKENLYSVPRELIEGKLLGVARNNVLN